MSPKNYQDLDAKVKLLPGDILIPVMGISGSGKSTFINTLVGEHVMGVGTEIDSCTVDIAAAEVALHKLSRFKWLKGFRLILVDTPDYSDDPVERLKFELWLENAYHKDVILGGLIYLHDISKDRLTGTARKALTPFTRQIVKDSLDKVVFGITKSDRTTPQDAARLEKLKEVHWKEVMGKGAKVFRLDQDNSAQAENIVAAVLERIEFEGTTRLLKNPRTIVIPVLGATGSGKSTFINTILEQDRLPVGDTQDSCTVNLSAVSVDANRFPRHRWLESRTLLLVDTPGFDNASWDDLQILEKIQTWLADLAHNNRMLGGVIYLHDISIDRIPGFARTNLPRLLRTCGTDALDQVVLVTTKSGNLTSEEATRRQTRLKTTYWEPMIRSGAQVFPFDKDFVSGSRPLDALLDCILRTEIRSQGKSSGKPSGIDGLLAGIKDIVKNLLGL